MDENESPYLIRIISDISSAVYECESFGKKTVNRKKCFVMKNVKLRAKGRYGYTVKHFRTVTIPCRGRRVEKL